jgi:hypothetical protein
MKKKLIVLFGFMALAPLAFAQAASSSFCSSAQFSSLSGGLGNILCKIGDILNAIIPILVVLGVLYFIWGVITYMIGSDEEAKKAGRDRIIFGIIGLAVIVAMWGLVNILINTFTLNANTSVTLPAVVPSQ